MAAEGVARDLVPNHVLESVQAAFAQMLRVDPRLATLVGIAFAAALVCDGNAWRVSLAGHGTRLRLDHAVARYAIGSLVNALLPARIGAATRLGLFVRVAGGGATAVTASAIGGIRVLVLAALAAVGLSSSSALSSASGRIAALVVAGLAVHAYRRRGGCARLAAWVLGSTLLRLVAAAVIAAAFGIPAPLVAACTILAASGLAGTFPVTPGNAGVGAAAVAVALAGRGVPEHIGIAAGITYGCAETFVAVSAGLAGLLSLAAERRAGKDGGRSRVGGPSWLRRRSWGRPPVEALP